ncbi:MAG TPA: MFS transporter [Phycisphaerae bacterium]|nr:MFS transporter [Phycisphaerae bacterium]
MSSPVLERKTWSTGTLTYTKLGLIALFAWLLWGDFCFTLMERLRPAIMPLFLMGEAGGIKASNKIVYAMMVVIPGITGLFIGPAVSFKSDRHRGPKGRRIPYIIWTTPLLVMGLVGMGFAPGIRNFFAGTWYRAQTVTVTATGDAQRKGDHNSLITPKVASADPTYEGASLDEMTAPLTYYTTGVAITETDDETKVDETAPYWGWFGPSSDEYTLVLRSKPTADVTITVAPDDQVDLGQGPGKAISLTFSADNWDSPQTVKVRAIDDDKPEGKHVLTIKHTATSDDSTYNGITIDDLAVEVTDNDGGPGVTVELHRGKKEVKENGATPYKYYLVLDVEPTADVTIAVTPDAQVDLGAGPGKAISLTFTPENWDSNQAVTVTAIDDATPEGPHTSTITHAVTSADPRYNGMEIDDVVVKVTDDDLGVIITQTKATKTSPESTDVRETGPSTDGYSVVLGTEPTADVTIVVSCDDQVELDEGPGEVVELTFAPKNWAKPQTVTVKAIDDDKAEGRHTSTITHTARSDDTTYDGIDIPNVVANVADNDLAGVTITEVVDEDDADADADADQPKPAPASRQYTVVLDSKPADDVAVTLTPDPKTDLGAGPGTPVTLNFSRPRGQFLGLDPFAITLLAIGIFVVMFHFFDEFVNSVFWYLFADVVPDELLGRFLALFRLVGTAAGALFQAFVFPHAETHMPHIFFGISILYLFGFTVMCWRVKEGEYPPPDDLGEKPSVFKQIKVYLSECFSHPIYIFMFSFTALYYSANVVAFGQIIFIRDAIQLSMKQIGMVGAAVAIVTMIFQYPSGWLVDKFHAVRVTFVTLIFMIPLDFFAFFYLRDLNTYIILAGLKLVVFGLHGAAGMPLYVLVFPRDKYGQFASCNGMMRSTSLMVTGIVGAMFMDYFTNNSQDPWGFRWMFIWMAICQALAAVALFIVFGIWKKRGGAKGYVPPGSLKEREMLAAAAAGGATGSVEATDTVARDNAAAEANDAVVNGDDAGKADNGAADDDEKGG